MRDKNTSTYIFKQNLDEIAKLMAFEVTRHVSLKDKAIETPVCPMVGKEMDQQIILAPILRAGIGLVDGFRDIIPTAKVGHIGMERDEENFFGIDVIDDGESSEDIDVLGDAVSSDDKRYPV